MNRPICLPALLTLFFSLPAQAVFTDNLDGTVTDSVTGLMWDKCSWGQSNNTDCSGGAATTHTWVVALGVAVTANAASYKVRADWRLPNKNELASLAKIDTSLPAIDAAFPNTMSSWYWSSTSHALDPTAAWVVYFYDGAPNGDYKINPNYVRLVRSGQSFGSFDSLGDNTAPLFASATVNGSTLVMSYTEANTLDAANIPAASAFTVKVNTVAQAAPTLVAVDANAKTVTLTLAVPVVNGDGVTVGYTDPTGGDDANAIQDAAGNDAATITDQAVTNNTAEMIAPVFASATVNGSTLVISYTEANTLDAVNIPAASAFTVKVNTVAQAAPTLVAVDANAKTVTLTLAAAVVNGDTVTLGYTDPTGGNDANAIQDAAGNDAATIADQAVTNNTALADTTPDAFSFTAQTGVALSTATTSNTITVAGINSAAAITIAGGSYAISGGAYTSAAGTVNNGNTVTVRLTSSGSYTTLATATLTIGGVDGLFAVTTAAAPSAPEPAPDPTPTPTPATTDVPPGGSTTVTGTTAVTVSNGGTVVIPNGTGSTGATIALPLPSTSGAAPAPVTISVNGQNLTVTPTAAGTVLGVKTITVNGVSTQVLSVTSGSVSVTASLPNQPLLAVGGGSGSNAIVVTAVTAGTAATSTVNAGTGETLIAVSSGVVTLPTNAFAQATGNFAAIKDGNIYAGEIAVLNSAGKITSVRLGSMGGAGNVGDPLKTPSTAGLSYTTTIPNLKGTVARISTTQDFGDVITELLGAGFTSNGQNSNGVLSLSVSGINANALPTGDITVDTSRSDGVTTTGNGKVEVAKSGVIASFVPTVTNITQLAGLLIAADKSATVTVNEDGVIQASLNGVSYGVQPGWAVNKASGGAAGFSSDAQGQVVYQDGAGNRQTLYPVFIDLAQIVAAFKPTDANARVTGNADGTITAKYLGVTYTLTPDYLVIPVPAAHATEAWWVDGGKVYVKNSDGKTAQGFAVK